MAVVVVVMMDVMVTTLAWPNTQKWQGVMTSNPTTVDVKIYQGYVLVRVRMCADGKPVLALKTRVAYLGNNVRAMRNIAC